MPDAGCSCVGLPCGTGSAGNQNGGKWVIVELHRVAHVLRISWIFSFLEKLRVHNTSEHALLMQTLFQAGW